MSDLTGQIIGNYHLRSLWRTGGMSSIYRAYQPNLEREVAFKILAGVNAFHPDFYERFSIEARLLATLEHPNIVPIHDFGTFSVNYFIVMRLLRGGTVEDRLEKYRSEGRMYDLSEAATSIREIAGALDYAHSRGFIHRDVKPANILFDDFGNAFLIDFGIAQSPSDAITLPSDGYMVGTPSYMGPEWLIEPIVITPALDQYALAATAFEMITGQLPYQGEDPMSALIKLPDAPIPSASALREDIPASLDMVFQRALAKDPKDRYPSARAFAEAFEDTIRFAGKKLRVFVSYSTRNREPVQQLVATLDALGHAVWYDNELRNTAGQNWWENILTQIRACDLFIFALTPDSLASYPCQLEYTYAAQLQKRILPVMLGEVNVNLLPAPLAALQFVNYMNADGNLILQNSLDNLPPANFMPDPLPAAPPIPVSELSKLSEQIELPDLSEDDQLLLVAKLEKHLDEVGTANEARSLLIKMQGRTRLFAATDRKIRKLLTP